MGRPWRDDWAEAEESGTTKKIARGLPKTVTRNVRMDAVAENREDKKNQSCSDTV